MDEAKDEKQRTIEKTQKETQAKLKKAANEASIANDAAKIQTQGAKNS